MCLSIFLRTTLCLIPLHTLHHLCSCMCGGASGLQLSQGWWRRLVWRTCMNCGRIPQRSAQGTSHSTRGKPSIPFLTGVIRSFLTQEEAETLLRSISGKLLAGSVYLNSTLRQFPFPSPDCMSIKVLLPRSLPYLHESHQLFSVNIILKLQVVYRWLSTKQ